MATSSEEYQHGHWPTYGQASFPETNIKFFGVSLKTQFNLISVYFAVCLLPHSSTISPLNTPILYYLDLKTTIKACLSVCDTIWVELVS